MANLLIEDGVLKMVGGGLVLTLPNLTSVNEGTHCKQSGVNVSQDVKILCWPDTNGDRGGLTGDLEAMYLSIERCYWLGNVNQIQSLLAVRLGICVSGGMHSRFRVKGRRAKQLAPRWVGIKVFLTSRSKQRLFM